MTSKIKFKTIIFWSSKTWKSRKIKLPNICNTYDDLLPTIKKVIKGVQGVFETCFSLKILSHFTKISVIEVLFFFAEGRKNSRDSDGETR